MSASHATIPAGPRRGPTRRPSLSAPALLAPLCLLTVVGLAATACTSARSGTPVKGAASPSPGASRSGPASSDQATIIMKNFSFEPPVLRVSAGQSVAVVDEDSAAHTVTSLTGAFDTGDVQPGQTAHFTAPSRPGTYRYRCTIHQFMTGTLVVTSG